MIKRALTQKRKMVCVLGFLITLLLVGCPDLEDTPLGEGDEDGATPLTLSTDCATACQTIETCSQEDFDEEGCIVACSEGGEKCDGVAACVASFGTYQSCEYDLQCEMTANPECFDPVDTPADDELDVCATACLNLCGIDHSVATCLAVCNSRFDEDPASDCSKLWTCVSELECPSGDWIDVEEFCPEYWDHACIYRVPSGD